MVLWTWSECSFEPPRHARRWERKRKTEKTFVKERINVVRSAERTVCVCHTERCSKGRSQFQLVWNEENGSVELRKKRLFENETITAKWNKFGGNLGCADFFFKSENLTLELVISFRMTAEPIGTKNRFWIESSSLRQGNSSEKPVSFLYFCFPRSEVV